MDPQRWQRARALFEAAVDQAPGQGDALLDAEEDDEVRAEARALLEADRGSQPDTSLAARAPDLLDALVDSDAAASADRCLGRQFGVWRILHLLGQGGMGAVYLAERVEGGFTQRAALKLVRPGFGAEDLLQRFRYERQILAGLEHPNIARLLDGGAGPGGEPYLALEYVEGEDLRAYCDSRRLDLDARLRLFLTVCDAVAHAHSRLVVHRDLKPSNILITADGSVKLLDFGIAKLLDAGLSGEATTARLRRFTPEYAAPEQVRGEPAGVAVDVYALGVLLYELLTGRRPYRVERGSVEAIEHAVLTQEPGRPSSQVTQRDPSSSPTPAELAGLRHCTPPRLRARLRGDLDAIVLKALRKQPGDRYASLRLLSDDIEAHLQHRPVSARRGSRRYRVGRFVQRHAVAVGFAALALVALLGGLGAALWQAHEAQRERDVAQAEAAKSAQTLAFMQGLFELADPEIAHGEQVSARELLDRGSERIRDQLRDQPAARAAMLQAMGEARLGLGLQQEALPLLKEAYELALSLGDPAAIRDSGRAYARCLHDLARAREAFDVLLPLREGFEPRTDAERLSAAALDHRLALALHALGRRDEAEARYRAALDMRERLLGLAHRHTQAVISGYVALLELHGRREESMALAERGLAALPDRGGADPLRADALAALAMVKTNAGAYEDAEALRREALASYREVFGAEHSTTVSAESDLATVIFNQRRYAESVPIFERVLAAQRKHYAPEHTRIALTANNLAFAHLMCGDPAAALPLAEEALRLRLARYGENHTNTAMSHGAVGATLLELGELDRAEHALKASVSAFENTVGPESSYLVPALNNLARIELLRGAPSADCTPSTRATRLSGSDDPGDDKRKHYTRAVHAACLVSAGDRDALAMLRDSHDAYRRLVRDDDRYVPILDALLRQAESR